MAAATASCQREGPNWANSGASGAAYGVEFLKRCPAEEKYVILTRWGRNLLKTEAGRLQAEASDQWAYYQAKGIKATVQETSRAVWLAAGKTPPANIEQSIQRYAAEQREIEKDAREKERQRDDRARGEGERARRRRDGDEDPLQHGEGHHWQAASNDALPGGLSL